MRFVKNSSLSLFFLTLLLLSLVFQAIVGHDLYNDEEPQLVSFGRYLFTSHFGRAVLENWQSEYLQFSLMILATVWLVQRGSTESKELDKVGPESDQQQRVGGTRSRTRRAGRKRPASGCGSIPTRCCS